MVTSQLVANVLAASHAGCQVLVPSNARYHQVCWPCHPAGLPEITKNSISQRMASNVPLDPDMPLVKLSSYLPLNEANHNQNALNNEQCTIW